MRFVGNSGARSVAAAQCPKEKLVSGRFDADDHRRSIRERADREKRKWIPLHWSSGF